MQKNLKIVAISDTHSSLNVLQQLIHNQVQGDIFIHAGDFTRYGRQQHFRSFFKCLEELQFTHKIVVAGNHDISLDNTMKNQEKQRLLQKYPCQLTRQTIVKEIKQRASYLQHDLIEIQGISIFGSPYTAKYSKGAFQYSKKDDHQVWSNLPQKIDILITHSPPYGILDSSRQEKHAGSVALAEAVKKIRPKLHIFGHIHEAHGREERNGTYFMNVARMHEFFLYKC